MKEAKKTKKMVFLLPLIGMAMLGGGLWSSTVTHAKMLTEEVKIVMDDKEFHVVKGGMPGRNEFELVQGLPTEITLENKDVVAHEFMSTLLTRVPVQVSGEATVLSTKRARGFRVDGGKTVTLSFIPPVDTETGETMYDVFWCNIHGKHYGDAMRGEILTVATTTGTGAF